MLKFIRFDNYLNETTELGAYCRNHHHKALIYEKPCEEGMYLFECPQCGFQGYIYTKGANENLQKENKSNE